MPLADFPSLRIRDRLRRKIAVLATPNVNPGTSERSRCSSFSQLLFSISLRRIVGLGFWFDDGRSPNLRCISISIEVAEITGPSLSLGSSTPNLF